MTAAATAGALSRADLEARIVKRCWTDEAFRRELLADPAACFVKYTGLPAEQAPNIVVHQESGADWHIVIPAKPRSADELSDADLERVAGGTAAVLVPIFTALASISVTASAAASVTTTVTNAGPTDPW